MSLWRHYVTAAWINRLRLSSCSYIARQRTNAWAYRVRRVAVEHGEVPARPAGNAYYLGA